MERDFRSTAEAAQVQRLYEALFAPGGAAEGGGHVFSARGLCGSGDDIHFIGQSFDGGLDEGPGSRLCRVRRGGGAVERLNAVETRAIRLAPDGTRLAVATAGAGAGDRIEVRGGAGIAAEIPGRIEQIDWSPDGARLLLLVAGRAADLAGIHGGFAQEAEARAAAWLPDVRGGEGRELWRRVWVWDLADAPQPVTAPPVNVWEATWCGPARIAAVVSDDHGEGSWYAARLALVDAATGAVTEVVRPADQLGCVRGSPDGGHVAYVAALCSDRGLVAGTLTVVDLAGGTARAIPTAGLDITSVEWRSASVIHVAGLRDCETVNADVDLASGGLTVLWSSETLTHGEWAPTAAPFGTAGSLFVAEGYASPPAIVLATPAGLEIVAPLAAPSAAQAMAGCAAAAPYRWRAADGWAISGWLVSPAAATGPTPLLVDVHGGPVSAHRNRWMARLRATPLLAAAGWTVLMPNPRGSTGRGDGFVRAVKGDMGGADAHDILAGIAALVAEGRADPARIAVTGTSYGGFMSAWLPTITDVLAAAVPISPVGDWMSQHRTTQIPEFDAMFLDASPWAAGGAYFERSPAFFRQKKPVPTLVMAGGTDRSTPPGQALECHFAARASGAPSTLLTYPKAGHSLRSYPEYLDSAARVLRWLSTHVAPTHVAPTDVAPTGPNPAPPRA